MFKILQDSSENSETAYTHLLEFIVGNVNPHYIPQFDSKLEWYFNNTKLAEPLNKLYTNNLLQLRADFHDHVGELYLENVVSREDVKKQGLVLTPPAIVKFMTKAAIDNIPKEDERPLNILDPCVGSGRFLLEAYKVAPKANLFGVDINLDLVRACVTNLELRNIKKHYILHANSLLHEIAITNDNGIYNWNFSNSWQSHIAELKTI